MTRPSDREREEVERPAQTGAAGAGSPGDVRQGEAAAAGLPAGADATPEQQQRAMLDEALRERDQFRAMAMRAQADLVNYRKRVDEEREQLQRAASAQLLLKLFPILDDLDRALAEASPDQPWVEGVMLIQRKFQAFLEGSGVERLVPLGRPFDPWEHEVVAYQNAPGNPDGVVIAVIANGYKMNGRVLQPARVVVAKASTQDPPATPSSRSLEA